jgi:hypothetical protein
MRADHRRPPWLIAWHGPRDNRMTGPARRGDHGRVDVDSFVRDGFVVVRQAVDEDTVAACQELIWAAMGHGTDPSPVARAIVRGLAATG